MNSEEQKRWHAKNERLNKNIQISRGMRIKDVFGHTGIVVEIVEGESQENHGVIAVWQDERVSYGLDNCEHYPHYDWQSNLRILEH